MKVELQDPSRRTNNSCCLEKFATGICFEDFRCAKRWYYTRPHHRSDGMIYLKLQL